MAIQTYRYIWAGFQEAFVNARAGATTPSAITPAYLDVQHDDATKADLDAVMASLGWTYSATSPSALTSQSYDATSWFFTPGQSNQPQLHVDGTLPVQTSSFDVDDTAYFHLPIVGKAPATFYFDIDWYSHNGATSGNVNFDISLVKLTPNVSTTGVEALLAALNAPTAEQIAVPATDAKRLLQTQIAVAFAAAVGDVLFVRLRRVAASASEMTGRACVLRCNVRW